MTYGYITKHTRITHNFPKEHYIDARCISGNPIAVSPGEYFYQRKVRCHNRQIHKTKILKGGRRKLNQSAYLVKNFRLFDKVEYQKLMNYINNLDPKAFITVYTVADMRYQQKVLENEERS